MSSTRALIRNYLSGSLELDELRLCRENGREFLKAAKEVDALTHGQGFSRTTYPLRTRILKLCSPEMETSEAYTKTTDPKKMFDYAYLKDPQAWIPDRVGVHAKLIANQFVHAVSLSKWLAAHSQPEVNAIRGGTGVGKTHYLGVLFSQALDEKGDLPGVLSPDCVKGALKKQSPVPLTNRQVYVEGTALFALFQQAISNRQMKIITDTRLLSVDYFESSVLEPAKRKKGVAHLVDLDGPLEVSIYRVLARDPWGKEACVSLDVIAEGYAQNRENRANLIERVKKEATIAFYQLYGSDEEGRRTLLAEKREQEFRILHQKMFEACLQKPSQAEISQICQREITSESIARAIARGDIQPDQRPLLELWKGKTLAQAMKAHVQRARDTTEEWVFVPDFIHRMVEEERLYIPFILPLLDRTGFHFPLAITDARFIAFIEQVPYPDRVRRINLSGSGLITDRSLSALARKCHFLTEINCSWCEQVTNVGLKALSRCSLLEKVKCGGCRKVTDEGVIAIAQRCKQLKAIDFSGDLACNIPSSITDLSLEALAAGCPLLEEIDLALSLSITDQGIIQLAQKCPLRIVELGWCRSLSEVAFMALGNCKQLEKGSFPCCKMTDKALFVLTKLCPNLVELNLGYTDISEEEEREFLIAPPPSLKQIAFRIGDWITF